MAYIYASGLSVVEPRSRQLMNVHPRDDGTDEDNLASSILSDLPKIPIKQNLESQNNENWLIREHVTGYEELYSMDRTVYHTRNSLNIKSFNFTEKVVKIFWNKFGEQDHICIALASGISIFDRLGQHIQIPLPFAYQDMYPTKYGIVIERNCDPLDDLSFPVLFALTHPTQEISPILFKPSPKFVSLPKVVACHNDLGLCLVYNPQDFQHSIWAIRKATPDEVDEFQRGNDNSFTMNTFTHYSVQSNSFREGQSGTSLNLSSRQRSNVLQQSNPNNTNGMNFSPKMDLRSKHSTLGNLAASRLGVGGGLLTPEPSSTNVRSFSSTQNMNMMSTPNRNRIINYLRDNIEEPILPQLSLEQIWIDQANNSSRATKFFSTKDMANNQYLVLVVPASSQVKVIKFETKNNANMTFSRAGFITAIDASPIDSMNMMIVIDSNKYLALYSGLDRVTNIIVPQSPTSNLRTVINSSPAHPRNTIDMTPIHMSSARKRSSMGERSSFGMDLSIQQMCQGLSPVPHATKNEPKTIITPMSINDVKNIEYVAGKTIYIINGLNQRARFEIPPLCQTQCIMRLLDSMKLLVSKELGLLILTKWYQTRRSSTQPELMHAREEMKLFKNWFLKAIGFSGDYFDTLNNDKISEQSMRMSHQTPSKKPRKTREIESNQMTAKIYTLFYGMHLVFEELLLNKLNYEVAQDLVELLMVLACLLRSREYQNSYWIRFPHLQDKLGIHKAQLENLLPEVELLHKPSFFTATPPCLLDFIGKIVTRSLPSVHPDDQPTRPYPNLRGVTNETYAIISLFSVMFGMNESKTIFDISATSNIFPTYDIFTSRPTRTLRTDEAVVELMVKLKLTRNYLSRLPEGINLHLWDAVLNCRESPPTNWSESCFELIGRMDLVNLVRGNENLSAQSRNDLEDETLKLIFSDDIRVSEAQRMLASHLPVEFNVVQRQGSTEDESRDETHRHLYLLNVRTMAMPVGRGAICLRTYSPVIGESFEVPRLELTGRSLSEDRPIEYTHDISVYPWPFFHNGVAAGLTICASNVNNIIDSTWINYNRPRSNIPQTTDARERDISNMNNEHAGFLFALGLNGHLEKLSLMALHDYLCQNNDLTKLAILLGMSAAKRGTRDNNIIKVLSIHVDALLPPNSTELDVPAPVHAGSIIGVGLLYQGSGDSHISKVLLEEIGRLPGPEANSHIDRESYSLSAGIAFGLVNLCKGGSSTITSSDLLRLYMLGGQRKQLTLAQRERYFKQDCHRGEEEYINTHITSPGGTLGLGLMYHRSNNRSVANWMKTPDTQTLLEYVRPDFLILRMLSYGLIMWNEIEPTEDWIRAQMPKIVSTYAFQRNSSPVSAKLVDSNAITDVDMDYELISQAYCNIIAGCCLAISMRYAGTANPKAYKTVYHLAKMLITLNNKPTLAEQAGRPCIEACLNVLVTSLAVIMAGTGDLGVMRLCRYLRSRLTQSCVFYGSYMAIHMALGILFLGSCRYSLSSSPESIGALICALYPIYPNHSSDNRYHLQALRHLYVLAAEPRLLIPRDIQTNKPVSVNITVKQKKDQQILQLNLKAPCLMPEINSILSVCVDDERYWRIEINSGEALTKCLFKNQGFLCVKQKAHPSNNQLVQDIESYILQNSPQDVIKSRKTLALSECVKEDRVEQYSALNELLTKHNKVNERFLTLFLDQIRLACALNPCDKPLNKFNLLTPIVGQYNEEFLSQQVHREWCNFLTQIIDWTKAKKSLAYYMTLNDLKCSGLMEQKNDGKEEEEQEDGFDPLKELQWLSTLEQ